MKKIIIVVIMTAITTVSYANETETKGRISLAINKISGDNFDNATGLTLYFVANKYGFYASYSMGGKDKSNDHYDSLGLNSFGDTANKKWTDTSMVSLGATYSFFGGFGAYLGVTSFSKTGYAEKYDSNQILSSSGYYTVNDTANNKSATGLDYGITYSTPVFYKSKTGKKEEYHFFLSYGKNTAYNGQKLAIGLGNF